MFLGGPGQHRILGDSYTDEQLFRIIVPRRFTLRRHKSKNITLPGFSAAIPLKIDKIPEYSDADIALVLRYRWPDRFAELEDADIAEIDLSVRGGGMHLKSGVDPLEFDDPTLSEYCHENIYNNFRKRTGILNAFKRELAEAKKARIEDIFEEFEPHILEYIFVARLYMAMSWDKIALSLAQRGKKPTGFLQDRDHFDGITVMEIYQMNSQARTKIFEECVFNKASVQKVMAALPPKVRAEHEQRSKLSTNEPVLLRKILWKKPLGCQLSFPRTDKKSKRRNLPSIPPVARPATKKAPEPTFGGDFQLIENLPQDSKDER